MYVGGLWGSAISALLRVNSPPRRVIRDRLVISLRSRRSFGSQTNWYKAEPGSRAQLGAVRHGQRRLERAQPGFEVAPLLEGITIDGTAHLRGAGRRDSALV